MSRALKIAVVVLLAVALLPLHAEAQQPRKKKKKKAPEESAATVTLDLMPLYNEGSYPEIAEQVGAAQQEGKLNPEALYVAALAYGGMRQQADALRAFEALAEGRSEEDAWRFIAESGAASERGDLAAATSAGARAAELQPDNKFAHYQYGRALLLQKQYEAAGDAFRRALEVDGAFAYAHYGAGIAFYQFRSMVAAQNHLARFVDLAPNAPERPQVEGILAAMRS